MKLIVFVLDIPACVLGFYWQDATVTTSVAPVCVVGDLAEFLALLALFFGLNLGLYFGL
jgi:hypothetical protein